MPVVPKPADLELFGAKAVVIFLPNRGRHAGAARAAAAQRNRSELYHDGGDGPGEDSVVRHQVPTVGTTENPKRDCQISAAQVP